MSIVRTEQEIKEQYENISDAAAKIMAGADQGINAIEQIKNANASDFEKIEASGGVLQKIAKFISDTVAHAVLGLGNDFLMPISQEPSKAEDMAEITNSLKDSYRSLCDLGTGAIDNLRETRSEFMKDLDLVKSQVSAFNHSTSFKGLINTCKEIKNEFKEDYFRTMSHILIGEVKMIDDLSTIVGPSLPTFLQGSSLTKAGCELCSRLIEHSSLPEDISGRLQNEIKLMREIAESETTIKVAKQNVNAADKKVEHVKASSKTWHDIEGEIGVAARNAKNEAMIATGEAKHSTGARKIMCELKAAFYTSMGASCGLVAKVARNISKRTDRKLESTQNRADMYHMVLDYEDAIRSDIDDKKTELKQSRQDSREDKIKRLEGLEH